MDGVDAAFRELSAFIQNGGLKTDEAKTEAQRVIKPGDWIDLEGGLAVDAYTAGGGAIDRKADEAPFRLIVVGINSFQSKTGGYTYPEGESTPPQHVVFHFQNIPVTRRMNDNSNGGGKPGYENSENRKYLTKNFLPGLINAGVPNDVLWGPARIMSSKPGEVKINDLLWLPTSREMFKDGKDAGNNGPNFATGDETAANQTELEYYTEENSNTRRIKTFGATATMYRLASISGGNENNYCIVNASGGTGALQLADVGGCVPAFCVK